jgi:multidrug efflux system membrane fusion protein
VVTTGFANLSDGAKVMVGRDDQTPSADLAPRKRGSRGPQGKDGQGKAGLAKDLSKDKDPSRDGQAKDEQAKDGQARDWQGKGGERRRRREQPQSEGDSKGASGSAQGSEQSGGGAKSQP